VDTRILVCVLACILANARHNAVGADDAPVLITGATGGTGSLIYNLLKGRMPVRALVRNITKARSLLGCSRCDESEGIFEGDVTEPETLLAPSIGAKALVIAVGPSCHGPYPSHCIFPKGAEPVDIDWHGGKHQVDTFANTSRGIKRPILLISTMETVDPTFVGMTKTLDYIHFYKLNLEAHLMATGVPFTIFKPCMFSDGPPGQSQLLPGHDDTITTQPNVTHLSRADLARLVVAGLQNPGLAAGLRFDVCSRSGGPATPDSILGEILKAAAYHWN